MASRFNLGEMITVSIELPEAHILAKQMKTELVGKVIEDFELANYEKLQRQTFFNENLRDYELLKKARVIDVSSVGVVIRVHFHRKNSLLLSPELGGFLLYHPDEGTLPKKFHLRLDFDDGSHFTVRLKGYGLVRSEKDKDLDNVYVYRRDTAFPNPLDKEFTFNLFSRGLDAKNQPIKTAIVGKHAAVIGFGNQGFQEIAHTARLHPKRKTASLTAEERKRLFNAIKTTVERRIKMGGKDAFTDIYGNAGGYVMPIGPHTRDKPCPVCGTVIARFQFAGGPTYYCPQCQIEP
jgi:formamidopyrimidine-DNA glycosylase